MYKQQLQLVFLFFLTFFLRMSVQAVKNDMCDERLLKSFNLDNLEFYNPNALPWPADGGLKTTVYQ